MCEFSKKLVGFLDGELDPDEIATVECHLQHCKECRNELAVYRRTSDAVAKYFDAVAVRAGRWSARHWAPALAGMAAAIAVLAFMIPRSHVQHVPPPKPAITHALPVVANGTAAERTSSVAKVHPVKVRKPIQNQLARARASIATSGPAIQISIPADSIFAPGALPEGVSFRANVTFAPDGAVQQVSLQQ